MKAWQSPRTLNTPGNTCTGCHRIGDQHTCKAGMYDTFQSSRTHHLSAQGAAYPANHWMPPGNKWTAMQWQEVYQGAIQALALCCESPTADGCEVTDLATLPGG